MGIFKNQDRPIVHIESFGVLNDKRRQANKFDKYYIISLEYKIGFLKNNSKIVYLPILFDNEEDACDFIKLYDYISFFISGRTYVKWETHVASSLYPSNYLHSLDLIYNKIKHRQPRAECYTFNVEIEYRGFLIYTPFVTDEDFVKYDINNYVSINNDKNCIDTLKDPKGPFFPVLKNVYVRNLSSGLPQKVSLPFKNVLKYIDDIIKNDETFHKEQDSLYSKKSFMLVENR